MPEVNLKLVCFTILYNKTNYLISYRQSEKLRDIKRPLKKLHYSSGGVLLQSKQFEIVGKISKIKERFCKDKRFHRHK